MLRSRSSSRAPRPPRATRSASSSPETPCSSFAPRLRRPAHGIGTGSVAEHLQALELAGVPIALSGLSSKARGVAVDGGNGIELAPPTKLVELADWAETTLVY